MANHGTACSLIRIRNKYASVADKYSKLQICSDAVRVCVCVNLQAMKRICNNYLIGGLNSVVKKAGVNVCHNFEKKKKKSNDISSEFIFFKSQFQLQFLSSSFLGMHLVADEDSISGISFGLLTVELQHQIRGISQPG